MKTLSASALRSLTVEIVSAYIANNRVPPERLPTLLHSVYASLGSLASHRPQSSSVWTAKHPAVPIERSVLPDHIICLEDGRPMRSLRRYLMRRFNLTPEQYRFKWGLPPDYPMVAPSYSAERSRIARASRLGRRDGQLQPTDASCA